MNPSMKWKQNHEHRGGYLERNGVGCQEGRGLRKEWNGMGLADVRFYI